MVDYNELMQILSLPRHNGSKAEKQTRRALTGWLDKHQIPFSIDSFRLYPYFMVLIGLWLIFSRTLLAVAIWLRWGWPALPIALVGLMGGLVDVTLGIPLVSWPGSMQGKNILIQDS